MTRIFTREELEELGLPDEENGWETIQDKIIDRDRWAVIYQFIFRLPDNEIGEAWMIHYQRGATEYQEVDRWFDESKIEATLFHQVEVIETVWKPK